ncbi:MAG: hypothetical protein H6855_03170 [Rhodospirillales bacterium]|nr:hypothetical protein [Rhodospirillales bacterium]MCB9973529.1 hypothetical protein [Rhodospirillales bacterium]MCB9980675.1 hypothetical protein [Rhodospirillales bacterium]
MFAFFRKKHRPEEQQAEALYEKAVSMARQPRFYAEWQVPDTVDGRFEMISLHISLLILRLETIGSEDARILSQALFDQMFLDMDRSLREMGIGDLSVPRHMKRMLNGFNGRAQSYKQALAEVQEDALAGAIRRNIYGTLPHISDELCQKMAGYIRVQWAHLCELDLKSFQNAENLFIEGKNE